MTVLRLTAFRLTVLRLTVLRLIVFSEAADGILEARNLTMILKTDIIF